METPAVHPDIWRHLKPGEHVVWTGRSRGLDFGAEHILIPALYIAIGMIPLMAWLFGPLLLWHRIAIAAFGVVWAYGLLHALWTLTFAPFMAEAVLTDRRLYVRSGLIRRHVRRYGARHDKHAHRIRMLRLTGKARWPVLRLRGPLADFTGPVALRLEKPWDAAHLIKTTLNLPMPVEDRTH